MNARASQQQARKRRTRAQLEHDRKVDHWREEDARISAASPTWSEWIAAQQRVDRQRQTAVTA